MENNSNFEPFNSALRGVGSTLRPVIPTASGSQSLYSSERLEAEPEAEILFNVNWIGLIQVNVDESGNHHIFSKDRNTIKM
jgi:hypothetical protein